jgi:flavodoxin
VKILVVYYSRTGRTKQVAEAVAAGLEADLVPIEDVDDRTGALGYFWSGRDALFGRRGSIHPTETDPAGYDLVIVGTPVWSGRLSTPVRTYIADHRTDLKQVAFFCTEGAYGGPRVFKTMSDLSGQHPVATLEIIGGDLRSGRYEDKVSAFTRHITERV